MGSVPVCISLVNLKNESGAAVVVLPAGTSVNTGSMDGLARAAQALFEQRPTMNIQMNNGEILILDFGKHNE